MVVVVVVVVIVAVLYIPGLVWKEGVCELYYSVVMNVQQNEGAVNSFVEQYVQYYNMMDWKQISEDFMSIDIQRCEEKSFLKNIWCRVDAIGPVCNSCVHSSFVVTLLASSDSCAMGYSTTVPVG